MARRVLFQVQTPLGYKVVLTRDRWREIVRFKHPALAGHEKQLQQCIVEPLSIRASAKDPEVHLYYSTVSQGYLCALAGPGDEGERFVITAYFCKDIKKGLELWTR